MQFNSSVNVAYRGAEVHSFISSSVIFLLNLQPTVMETERTEDSELLAIGTGLILDLGAT